jgi:tRNA-Thr(GGU) m(6)t(6)A37 methyltransferase TsaA
MTIQFKAIGRIHTPFDTIAGMPIQPTGAAGVRGTVELFAAYAEGLKDLKGFSHIILLYHFHKSGPPKLLVEPFLDKTPHGVFATRAPSRPNAIGLSIVKLIEIRDHRLTVENIDVLDGTPLLDIKPYVPEFDHHPVDRTGWLARTQGAVKNYKSDKRFE